MPTLTILNNLPDPPCDQCDGACCKRGDTGHEYAVLLEPGEQTKFTLAVQKPERNFMGDKTKMWVIPYRKGVCVYLGSDNRCTVHDDKPALCKAFNCLASWKAWEGKRHGYFLDDNPKVVALLHSVIPRSVLKRIAQRARERKL